MQVRAHYYRQFHADHDRDVPAEGYGGWRSAELEIDPARTALVVMHAWDCGTRQRFPGWWRSVEYLPRAEHIMQTVFPPLLAAVRAAPLKLYHVVGGAGDYYRHYGGYRRTVELAGPEPAPPEKIRADRSLKRLRKFRMTHSRQGPENRPDIVRGLKAMKDFPPAARPVGDEPVAATTRQLFAVCKRDGVSHLVYAGFAVNWCLLLEPGGMAEMSRRGLICSAIREAVTAVENRETAREELCKSVALWRVGLAFGFVFDVDDFVAALQSARR